MLEVVVQRVHFNLGMIRKAHLIPQLWRHFGPKWLAYRLGYAARLRSGLLRRQLPITDWIDQPLAEFLDDTALSEPERYLAYRREQASPFFFEPCRRAKFQRLFVGWDTDATNPLNRAAEIGRGRLRYFERTPLYVGFPPDWHRNPFTQQSFTSRHHWSQIDDFGSGDIKIVWEPSRFGFTYTLVRAYWRTGDERFAKLFWQLVEDWREKNPPQQGVNWKCGQEISFRVMAWCFGLYGFLEATPTTAARVAGLAQMIAVSGQRVEANLAYALSQRNNHGISEGMGLWTIGLLFPEFDQATAWRETGRQVLESQGRDLIYDDGAFSQHSVNYHRLMLHDYLWAIRLGDIHNQPLSADLRAKVGLASEFLYQIQDKDTGRVPNYGANDGALILPLNNCDYQDFRPVIQAVHYLCTDRRRYNDGPWNEDLLWLFGPKAVNAPVTVPPRINLSAKDGGYYTLRAKNGFAFVRCATYRHRPGHADMLHLDLWWRGQNIVLDAGTYSYNAPEPWDNPLARTAYHNTVTVNGFDQMDRRGKFLWLPWLKSWVRYNQQSSSGHLAYWEGEHNGYQRLKAPVNHRRGIVRLADDGWLVLDRLVSRRDHHYRLHWLFPAVPYEWGEGTGLLTLHTSVGSYYAQIAAISGNGTYSLVQADEHSPHGWWTPYYYYREPALSVDMVAQVDSFWFWTLFSPEPYRVTPDVATLRIETKRWQVTIQLQSDIDQQQPLVGSVTIVGILKDRLEILS